MPPPPIWAWRQGAAPAPEPHAVLGGLLAETGGVLLFQEQVPQVARAAAAGLWDWLAAPGGYTFNKAHTTAYFLLAYWTAYLKRHHPAPYFAALLATELGYYGPEAYLQEARRLGVAVLPPQVNRSGLTCQVEGGEAIRMGLLQVRGVGPAAAAILAERAAGGPGGAAGGAGGDWRRARGRRPAPPHPQRAGAGAAPAGRHGAGGGAGAAGEARLAAESIHSATAPR